LNLERNFTSLTIFQSSRFSFQANPSQQKNRGGQRGHRVKAHFITEGLYQRAGDQRSEAVAERGECARQSERQRFGIAQALIGNPKLVIVDEPTAGLDPEERHRFSNLLAEIGELKVVILSTHIVEDVTDLCANMAILSGGRIVGQGKPGDLIARLHGWVWRRVIDKGEIDAARKHLNVISTRLREGRTEIHVVSDARPSPEFQPIEATLEDVYFAILTASRKPSAVAPIAV
jgi:ABC-type glutathione transport system ATPase component